MFKIVDKKRLNDSISQMIILAPSIARKAKPGQFIILRIDSKGERIPLTIAGYDRENGTVTIIFQKVGATTKLLDTLNAGDYILNFVGPLGNPSNLEDKKGKHIAVIGGGLGVAIAYPQAKALYEAGAQVDIIVGFRNKDLIILKDELKCVCSNLIIMTDDGSNGNKGFTTTALEKEIESGSNYDEVFASGPLPMMKAICSITKNYDVPTLVSMNPIMIDGTGMCGGCRLTVGGETKFACVDGPDFDGHKVDFDEAIRRSRMFKSEESVSDSHRCRLTEGAEGND